MLLLTAFLIPIFIIAAIGFILVMRTKHKGRLDRALNMSLFSVTLPRESIQPAGGKTEKELISVMEHLLSSFSNLHSKGWNRFVYGEPYIGLEMAVHHIGEEIHFYFSTPRSYEDIMQKQIHSLFPNAQIERVAGDYNIFNSGGVSLGTYFKLKSSELLPFKTYQKLEADPLGGIATALSKLQAEGEGASFQLLVRPSHRDDLKSLARKTAQEMQSGHDFPRALALAKKPAKTESKKDGQSASAEAPAVKPVTPALQDVISAVENKASKQTFDVNLRAVVSAPSEDRAKALLEEMVNAFTQYNSPDLNSVEAVKLSGASLRNLLFSYTFRLFDDRQKMYLSTEEIASIYHYPLATSQSPRVKMLKGKSAEPPTDLPQQGIVIGKNNFRGQEVLVRMSEEDRRRHLYILGQTGTGKTVTMKGMVRQDIEEGKGVCIIDPHGDFAEFALSVVPKERVEDVIYFDPGDIERPLGLNMLEMDPAHPEQKTMIIDELFSIFDKLYNLKETGGPMFEKYFKNSVYLLLDDYAHEVPTLTDIGRVLTDEAYRADKLSRETNPLVVDFWKKEAEQGTGEQSLSNFAPYITSKVNNFIFNEFLRPILNQKRSAFNFRDVMDNKKILILNLSKGRIGELNASFLGLIIVGKLLMSALSRTDIPEDKRSDFYLYMDEFQSFTTESISTILAEARKYRLNLIVAHQFIAQLEDHIRDAVFGNVGSMLIFRVSPEDAESSVIKSRFEPVFGPQDVSSMDNLNAFAVLLINGRPSRPFNIELATEMVFNAGSIDVANAIKELSRLKFGRLKSEVEQEITNKYQANNFKAP